MRIKNILISQPKPETGKNPFLDLANKHNLNIDFESFIKIDTLDAKEFRKQRISILDHRGIVFNSRNAIDHFFTLAADLRVTIPEDMKYFCTTEAVAVYLQKYIVYRKRKIFHGQTKIEDLIDTLKKHKNDKLLIPVSDKHKDEIPEFLDKLNIKYSKAIIYRTVFADLSHLTDIKYDMLVFFTPTGIESLLHNFPDFKQEDRILALWGANTIQTAKDLGFRVDISGPSPETPSMAMAIEKFITGKSGK